MGGAVMWLALLVVPVLFVFACWLAYASAKAVAGVISRFMFGPD